MASWGEGGRRGWNIFLANAGYLGTRPQRGHTGTLEMPHYTQQQVGFLVTN